MSCNRTYRLHQLLAEYDMSLLAYVYIDIWHTSL